jgi:hypothetical protein
VSKQIDYSGLRSLNENCEYDGLYFDVLLTVHFSIILAIGQLNAQMHPSITLEIDQLNAQMHLSIILATDQLNAQILVS